MNQTKTPKRQKKQRPKLQPIDSPLLATNSSSDELWDVVLTRARSREENSGVSDTTGGQNEINDDNPPMNMKSFSMEAARRVVGTGAPDCSDESIVPSGGNESEAFLSSSSHPTASLGRASSPRAISAALTSSVNRRIPSPQPTEIVAEYNSVTNNEDAPSSSTAGDNQLSPAENLNYASKYLDLSPPTTPELKVSPVKECYSNLTQTPETTDSSHQEAESVDLGMAVGVMEQSFPTLAHSISPTSAPLLENAGNETSTPIVSNVTSASLQLRASASVKNGDNQTPTQAIKPNKKRRKRLQPRSSLFSPDGKSPKTPDEDMYDVFGFNLHKKSRGGVNDGIHQSRTREDEARTTLSSVLTIANKSSSEPKQNLESSLQNSSLTADESGTKQKELNNAQHPRRTSTVSFSDCDHHESSSSLNTSTIHLIGSKSQESIKRECCSSSDSESITSDDYFNESRAFSLEHYENSASSSIRENRLTNVPALPVRSKQCNTSEKGTNLIDMKLSLSVSEEDEATSTNHNQEELILYQTYNTTKGESFGSSLVESASESEDGNENPTRSGSYNSLTSGSDDAGVVNELNAYHISSKIEAMNNTSMTLPGHLTPVGEGAGDSGIQRKTSNSDTPTPTNADGAKYIYNDVQSAIVDVKANNPGAHKPTSSMDNSVCSSLQQSVCSLQQYNNRKETPTPKMHSSRGAFKSTPQRQRLNSNVQLGTGLDSLVYSEDRIGEYSDPTDITPFRHMRHEFDEEMAACSPIYEEKYHTIQSSRWGVLLCMSMLNLMAGWTCFSVAAIASATIAFDDIIPEYLVSVFLLASCAGCFVEPMLRKKIGLRRTVVLGALLLMIGSLVKSGFAPLFQLKYFCRRIHFGFFLVGFSHPFYQSTIPIISNAWFPEDETRLASGVALYCFQLGIILSFVFGTIVKSNSDADDYFQLMSLISVMAFILVSFLVDDAPATLTPRSQRLLAYIQMKQSKQQKSKYRTSRMERKRENPSNEVDAANDIENGEFSESEFETKPLLDSQRVPEMASPMLDSYGATQGSLSTSPSTFWYHCTDPRIHGIDSSLDQTWSLIKACFVFVELSHCTAAYVASGMVINTLLTYLNDFIETNEAPKLDIWIVGGGFQLSVMLSVFIFSKCTKKSRRIHKVIWILLASATIALVMCSFQLGVELGLNVGIFLVGFLLGPVQYLSTQLAVLLTDSLNEDSVLIPQRFFSNSASAVCIPIFKILHQYSIMGISELHDFTVSFYFLILVTSGCAACFVFFDSRRKVDVT